MTVRLRTAGAIGALLLAMAAPAYAAEVSVGGASVSAGTDTSVSAGVGDTSASVSIGGGGGNVATGTVETGGNAANVRVGSGSGPLADVNQSGNPLAGTSRTGVNVNLGDLLGGGGAGGGNGNGNVSPGAVNSAFSDLSEGQQAAVRRQCRSVMASPAGFERDLVALCRLLAKL